MEIEKVLQISEGIPEEDRLGMILGNRIDMGIEAGGLISVKQFPQLAKDLITWRDSGTPWNLGLTHIWKDQSGTVVAELYGGVSLIPEIAKRQERIEELEIQSNGLAGQAVKDRREAGELRARMAELEAKNAQLVRFICESGGLVNEWAKSCPFGAKLTDHIKGELHNYLKRNP